MDNHITIRMGDREVFKAVTGIASPAEGVKQLGLIRIMGGGGQQKKHVVYMMAQRAMVDFEEKALEIERVDPATPLTIDPGGTPFTVPNGAVLAMNDENRIRFWIHAELEIRPMLVAFHRMATRMIRLDVP